METLIRTLYFATLIFAVTAYGQIRTEKGSASEPIVTLEKFIANETTTDSVGILPNEPVDSIFGVAKSLLDTPRSVSVLSDDMTMAYGIETALARLYRVGLQFGF